uniref:Endo-1,3,1,4-beta-D-glucanase n=1 Tax=Cajanus cajan TaxID=3821 RepID=A0A151STQ6_CAJCA|nr:Endo-1,3,1,4-beta-D-glucanase [Cajanus cajan]
MSGPECCSNPPVLNPNGGAGHVEKLAALNSYLTGSPDSNVALLLISDIFGTFCVVLFWVTMFFSSASCCETLKSASSLYPSLSMMLNVVYLDKGFEDAKSIIDALKSKGVSVIGAAGFCWGAKVVVELAKSRLIQAAVQLHPSFVSVDDIKGVDIPIAILGAEIDKMSPPELLQQFEQVLTAKPGVQVDSLVKIFPKVSHGWSVRYDKKDAEAVKAAEEAHQVLLNWYENTFEIHGLPPTSTNFN